MVEEVDDGVIVFDRLSDNAHWLDPTAAAVWGMADGHREIGVIAASCGKTEAEVADVVLRLEGLSLMVEQNGGGISRRAALKRIAKIGGTAAAGAAVISTVIVPNALATASVCDKIACSATVGDYQGCGQASYLAGQYCIQQPACSNRSSCEGSCTNQGASSTYSGTCRS